jgi:hypothetical protein
VQALPELVVNRVHADCKERRGGGVGQFKAHLEALARQRGGGIHQRGSSLNTCVPGMVLLHVVLRALGL